MNQICNEKSCSGCGACMNVCPKQCISFSENKYGELHPVIDSNLCINCKSCVRVCPQKRQIKKQKSRDCYAGVTKKQEDRLDSASGGIAASIYHEFFNLFSDGVIAGVLYDEEMKPVFYLSTKEESQNIDKYRGSKYVQAYTGYIYSEIGNLLSEHHVLFIGTPCQVAACRNYILEKKCDEKKLYTVDLICHGVAPYAYLKENIEFVIKNGSWGQVTNISFRSNRPLRNFHFVIEGEGNNKEIINISSTEDLYFYGFLKGIILRESCYCCKFACHERVGDLTIGDFIGYKPIQKFSVGAKDNISLILCNSDKGKKLLEKADSILLEKREINEAYRACISLNNPFPVAQERTQFIKFYPSFGFYHSMKKVVGIKYSVQCTKAAIRRMIKASIYRMRK